MPHHSADSMALPVALENGLVMRRARRDDADALADFNALIHTDPRQSEPSAFVHAWTHDLLTRPHPTVSAEDFVVVEEAATGKIVSTANLISQTWSYGGIEFGVGRPELVGTDPAYRGRGLVRRQFDVIHGWSAERGELVQAITGIRWFYRQFGYEMAVDLGGSRSLPRYSVPRQDADAADVVRVRAATVDDAPFVAEVDRQARARYLLSVVRDADLWRFEIAGRSQAASGLVNIIESPAGRPVGMLLHHYTRIGQTLHVEAVELLPGTSWLSVAPGVLRYLADYGAAVKARRGDEPFESLAFGLGAQHPFYVAAGEHLFLTPQRPYAFYMRVPDLPAFLSRVAPVLESRLAGSIAAGYSGELKLSFYRSGVVLRFVDGKLSSVEAFRPPQYIEQAAFFPDLTFLQLLFGWRSRDELEHAFPDCQSRGQAGMLVDALFPKTPSLVLPVG